MRLSSVASCIERCSEQFCGPVNKQMSFACHTFLIALTSLLISIVANMLFALIAKRLPRIPPNQCEPAHIERRQSVLGCRKMLPYVIPLGPESLCLACSRAV